MRTPVTRVINALAGRGYGSTSLGAEVRAALRFIPDPGRAVVFDIGANKGLWSRRLLDRCDGNVGRLIMFEPSSANWDQIEQRIGRGGELVRAAVGERPGRATLHADHAGSVLASLSQRRVEHFGMTFDVQEQVDVVSLDDFVAGNGIERVDFAKFDIEGHELEALRGAAQLLESRRLGALSFEFGGSNIDTRTYFQDFWYLFADLGYELMRITPFGLRRITRYAETDEFFLTTNYIAVAAHGAA